MTTVLPETIDGLVGLLRAGQMTLSQAARLQESRFSTMNEACHAATYINTVARPPLPAIWQDKPLAGVGLAHKDIFSMAGRAPGLGRDYGHQEPALHQAPVLQALEQAGALNLGALAMAEDACAATAQNVSLPIPINPLGAHLAVGGSSSGSAVAVAAGMVYASLGTDTAGSVRIPAMTCGAVGLKTTHGLLDTTGMAPLCPSLDSIGVIARGVGDVTSVMRVLAPGLKWVASSAKLAYWIDEAVIDDSIVELVRGVMQTHAAIRLDIATHEARAAALQETVMTYEVGQTHRERIASQQACKQVLGLGLTGLAMPESWWQRALADRQSCLEQFLEHAFTQADVLMVPLQVNKIPTVGEVYTGGPSFSSAKLLGLHHYCGWVNYLGLPALALPIGHDAHGLPVSIQLIGKPFSEPQLLGVGQRLYEEINKEQGIMPRLRKGNDHE